MSVKGATGRFPGMLKDSCAPDKRTNYTWIQNDSINEYGLPMLSFNKANGCRYEYIMDNILSTLCVFIKSYTHARIQRWFSKTVVEDRTWMSNYLPQETMDVIMYPYVSLSWSKLIKLPWLQHLELLHFMKLFPRLTLFKMSGSAWHDVMASQITGPLCREFIDTLTENQWFETLLLNKQSKLSVIWEALRSCDISFEWRKFLPSQNLTVNPFPTRW